MRPARRPACVLAAASMVLAASGIGSAPAAAAPAGPAVDSVVEAGYTARFVDHGSKLAVLAVVTVPTLACGPAAAGVVTSVGLVEVPYRFAGGRVDAGCAGGTGTYEARLESSAGGSQTVDEEVAAGDRIKITAVWNGDVGRPEVDVTMVNLDAGWRAGTRFAFIADGFNGAVFRQTPMRSAGAQLPVAEFAGAGVARARVGGVDLDDRVVIKSVLVDADGDRVVRPGRLSHGGRFTFSYVG